MNKGIINFKKLSIALIILPYLFFNYENIRYSSFFSFNKIYLLFTIIIIIDFLTKLLLSKANFKVNAIISISAFFAVFSFFYSIYIINFIQKFVIQNYGILIRGRIIIELGLLLFIILLIYIRKKNVNFLYLNVFLIIVSFVTIVSSLKKINRKSIRDYKANYLQISSLNTSKPLILIIVDEYASPDGLFNVYKDSSIYAFSRKLKNEGWKINSSFYSYETSTIFSLSSMFNFNLSLNGKYLDEDVINIGGKRLVNSVLADSLEKKKVDIINFGIFHFGKYQYLTPIYLYPTSFIEVILMNTFFYTFISNTGKFNRAGFTKSFYPQEEHNKYIFENITDTLSSIKNHKTFIYTHLYMPHYPFQYKPEFPLKTKNLKNYLSYWNFTNEKLEDLIKVLTKENRYRIIITGDHGYRSDKRVNPKYTFNAIYGFDEISLKKIKSVQDLGSLINSSF